MSAPVPTISGAGQPRWFRTRRPLRVAVIGWAQLAMGAFEGSGYNLSASELAAGLAMAGHRVFYLASGKRYGFLFRMRIRREETWRGVECHSLVNSPNLSPAAANFRNTRRELSSPGQTRLVLRWLDRVGAEVVHIHSGEGFPIDLVPAVRRTGRPVVVTPHNYWFVCPQVDLLRANTGLCTDYDGGRRCENCIEAAHPLPARFARRVEDTVRVAFGNTAGAFVRQIVKSIKRRMGYKVEGVDPASIESPRPDPELARGFDAGGPVAATGRLDHGFSLLPGEEPFDITRIPIDQNEQFLAAGRDVHLGVLNGSIYARRRARGLEALSAASLVTPPSRFLLGVHVAMGLDPSRGRVVRLGQPHFDQIHRRTKRSPYYDRRPWTPDAPGPCRFAFLGTIRPGKGLEVLTRAIPLLTDGVRRRCAFIIRAGGGDWVFRKRLAAFPEVDFVGGYDLLQLLGAGTEYDVGLLPHIWFENSPLVLLEHLHAGKFVIASRLGGPPEWITEPPDRDAPPQARREPPLYNGLMVPAGDPAALAAAITRIVRGEVALPSPREVHDVSPLRSYPDHVREVDGMYHELLGTPPPAGPPERGDDYRTARAEPPLIETRRLVPASVPPVPASR